MKKILLNLIKFYQKYISALLGKNKCRFYPSCSSYIYQCIENFGVLKGSYLGLKRILKCHPFNEGGYDPPPINKKNFKEEK